MKEEKLEKMENMLSQLITMVGNLNEKQQATDSKLDTMDSKLQATDSKLHTMDSKLQATDSKLDTMDSKLQATDSKLDTMEKNNEERHTQVLERLRALEVDQNFIWEKAVRNEREISILKNR